MYKGLLNMYCIFKRTMFGWGHRRTISIDFICYYHIKDMHAVEQHVQLNIIQ